jgi:hypothetical protein
MMIPVEEHLMLAGLETRRAALQRALSQMDRQIHQTEQAQARLERRIQILEQRPRQAA